MFTKALNEYISIKNLPLNIKKNDIYEILQRNPNEYTHSYFKYPCKFIPEIPRWAIKKYTIGVSNVIFDPFVGSGTTLLEGIINRQNVFGTEIDDIAKLVSKVKTTIFSDENIIEADKIIRSIMKKLKYDNIIPIIAKINNLNHWFPEENILKLGKIRSIINGIENIKINDFFKVCFISIIKKCSYADNVSPKPYVSNKIKKIPSDPYLEFQNIYNKYIIFIKDLSNLNIEQSANIINGDALKFSLNFDVDLAITSPPYINAFDYARTLRLENLWLDNLTENDLRIKKKEYIGTEVINMKEEEKKLEILESSNLLYDYYNKIYKVDKKRALIVKKFFENMKTNLMMVYKILKPNSKYCIVIGNSSIRKIEIESWRIIRDIGIQVGFIEELHFSYLIKNPYLRIPRNGKGGKMKIDNILVLKKV